jgi:tripartite-type tricarboxylate transporter receptor subunit TctC
MQKPLFHDFRHLIVSPSPTPPEFTAHFNEIRQARLRALAVTGKDRFPAVPNVPPAIESGVLPGYDVTTWYGVFAPHGTPAAIVAKLNKTLNDGLADEVVRKRLVAAGVVVKGSTPEESGKFMTDEYKRWNEVRNAAGIAQQ